jgi:hypothetical protein
MLSAVQFRTFPVEFQVSQEDPALQSGLVETVEKLSITGVTEKAKTQEMVDI